MIYAVTEVWTENYRSIKIFTKIFPKNFTEQDLVASQEHLKMDKEDLFVRK